MRLGRQRTSLRKRTRRHVSGAQQRSAYDSDSSRTLSVRRARRVLNELRTVDRRGLIKPFRHFAVEGLPSAPVRDRSMW